MGTIFSIRPRQHWTQSRIPQQSETEPVRGEQGHWICVTSQGSATHCLYRHITPLIPLDEPFSKSAGPLRRASNQSSCLPSKTSPTPAPTYKTSPKPASA